MAPLVSSVGPWTGDHIERQRVSDRHHPAFLVLAMCPLYVALVFAWGLAIRSSDALELGNAGEWFGGLATALAVAVALWVAIRDGRRRDEDRRDEQAAQARHVVSETEDVKQSETRLVTRSV